MKLIDSHAHIQEDLFPGEIDQVISRAQATGIEAIISVGTSLAESQEMLDLAEKYDGYLFPTVGLHPQDAAEDIKQLTFDQLKIKLTTLAENQKTVAIGECGFDYGKNPEEVLVAEKERQRSVFAMQATLAEEKQLPLIVHCRNAWEDTFAVLQDYSSIPAVILHSFTGDPIVAQEAIKKGYFLSFSGIVTFSNAKPIQEAAKLIPEDHILVETDSPYLAPEPMRGSKNEPKNVAHTLTFMANLRHKDVHTLASVTEENTKKVFGLSL